MKIPARCNRRSCQARRNLSKRPQLYQRWPTCHVPGCTGRMYVDEYRLRKGPKDNAPVCWCDACMFPHRVNSPECKRREDWILEQAIAPPSRHSPLVKRHAVDVPF